MRIWRMNLRRTKSAKISLVGQNVEADQCTIVWRRNPSFKRRFEPRLDKTINVAVRPAKTQISLGIRPVWSESFLSARRKLGSLATHWAHSEDYDQTGRMPRLIWVFAGRTVILLVLSWSGSFICLFCFKWTEQNRTLFRLELYSSSSMTYISKRFL